MDDNSLEIPTTIIRHNIRYGHEYRKIGDPILSKNCDADCKLFRCIIFAGLCSFDHCCGLFLDLSVCRYIVYAMTQLWF